MPKNSANESDDKSKLNININEKGKIQKRQELKNSLMQLSSEKEGSTRRQQANTDNLKTPKSKVLEDSRRSYTTNIKSKVLSSRRENNSSARAYERK